MRSRATLILFLLLVVGGPCVMALSILGSEVVGPATVGAQPGGTIAGHLDLPEGEPKAGREVRLFLLPDEGAAREQESVTTDADGAFSFDAPPVQGKYLVAAGGGEWQHSYREFSFLDREGEPTDPRELVVPVRRGCRLVVELKSDSGRRVDRGTWHLSGRASSGPLFGLVRAEIRTSGEFSGGRLEVDGLPPMAGELSIELDGGDIVRVPVELEDGEEHRTVEL